MRNATWVVEGVANQPGQTAFEVRKWRWVMARTFGGFNRYRRPSRDYEHNPSSSEAWIDIAMSHRTTRSDPPDKNKDDDLMQRPPKAVKT